MSDQATPVTATGDSIIDIRGIMQLLPHRFPMLLVDRVIECVPNERIVAIKNVSMNEPFFQGHYPHMPVMPGVMILESMAQAAGILSFKTMASQSNEDSVYYFVGIDGARFKRPVVPGDQLQLEVSISRQTRGIWKFAAKATVQGQVSCEAELMCTYRKIEQ